MKTESEIASLGLKQPIGSRHYRAFVGPPSKYDIVAAMQFNLLTSLGLREHHYLLDIGCGSLRAGRLFIPYLMPDRYYGVEPEQWLIEEGIKNQTGRQLIEIKRPVFSNDTEFRFAEFGQTFDYLLAQSIFSHAAAQQIRKALTEAKKVMANEAIFVATFIIGTENYSGEAWVYPQCVEYTPDYIVELARDAGLDCHFLSSSHPNRQTWVAFTHAGQGQASKNLLENIRIPDLSNPHEISDKDDSVLRDENQTLKHQIKNQANELTCLRTELTAIQSTRIWRVAQRWYHLKHIVLPEGSKRQRTYHLIRSTVELLFTEGPIAVLRRLFWWLRGERRYYHKE